MSREIKFRAWDTQRRRWSNAAIWLVADVGFAELKADPGVVAMQFTGLLDKNGREIYEGDVCKFIILLFEEDANPLQALLHVVEWKNACWGFRPLFPDLVHEDDREWSPFWQAEDEEMWDLEYFEVIGNIHENPELLKGGGPA